MIPTVLGVLSILAGIALVAYRAAQHWSRPGERLRRPEPQAAKPGVSYWVLLLVGLGAILLAVGTSSTPPPTAVPQVNSPARP